ncbi:hypothetical protein [Micromonospora chalcea]|uniref:hypothetical protein n=1 Tax=Micromonospora chalcea TaxID=1874 RepID=UPI000CE50A31|nr:hypothetical protein [Micromonospora chalcea]PPA56622.1 hypothetical protein BAW75_26980 [Micromonospora chalcea]
MSVVLASGHLVDRPDRRAPRFPERIVPLVASAIADALDRWQVAEGSVVVCGGARGADMLSAEAALARGAQVILCLAAPTEEFVAESVRLPGTEWEERFRRLLSHAEVRHIPTTNMGTNKFARTNAWMVGTVRELTSTPYALLVWDGEVGDGPGGTQDMVERLGYSLTDPHIEIIDPTALLDE